jgi:two-component system sensor histidine kinase AtoS
MVEVEIADRGSGIPDEILERVFEPFFTTKTKGTGLGLATVHRVVEAHGGQLLVKSRPGEGTSVRVMLPAAVS